MAKYLKALLGEKGDFVVVITDSTDTVKAAQDIHDTTPVATAAMGRTITAAKLMSLFLKDDGARLSLTIDGDGEMGKIVSFADFYGHLKIKMSNPKPETHINSIGKLDVSRAVGSAGYIRVMKDGDKIKPFTGQSEIVSGEIAEDIAHYYAISEQQGAAISLGVFVNDDGSVKSAGGLMLHVLPGTSEEELTKMENLIGKMENFSNYMAKTRDLQEILELIFTDVKIKVLEKKAYIYRCDCNEERASRAIASLSEEDKKQLRAEIGKIEVNCDYCGNSYLF